jgi:pyruvate dehydrogenase E2 component (dihydrolipoamide acetyltransferase)
MKFKVPNMGEGVEEAQVLKVLLSPGDGVQKEQGIIEIETDKATVEVPSPTSGTIEEIHVVEGDTITVGQLIATISEDGALAEAEASFTKEEEVQGAPEEKPEPQAAEVTEASGKAPEAAEEETPAVEAKRPEVERKEPAAERAPAHTPKTGAGPVLAAPSVRQFAREIGVPVREVSGSGPGGRISMDDVKRHARERPGAPAAARHPLPDFTQWGEVEREGLSKIRQSTARRMALSWSSIPHVTLCEKADATELESLRQQYKGRVEKAGGKLTITAMLLKLSAAALKSHPGVAASIDMEKQEIVRKDFYHIGVAIDTSRGLLVPVIHDVDGKNIMELARELTELSGRARDNKLSLNDYFTPIINHPEGAILGVGRAVREPVYRDDSETFEPRLMLPLSLSFDHRLMDGADGARFLHWLARAIEDPVVIVMEG